MSESSFNFLKTLIAILIKRSKKWFAKLTKKD